MPKCSLQKINYLHDPVDVTDGVGATLQFTMTDNGEPGLENPISITIWKRDGGLWFTNLWDNDTSMKRGRTLIGTTSFPNSLR